MSYAKGRIIHDADSHVMEPADWLAPHAEGVLAERLLPRATPERIAKQVEAARAMAGWSRRLS